MIQDQRFTFRLSLDDRAGIEARSNEYPGLSLGEFVRLSSLGQLPGTPSVNDRFLELEERLARVEHRAELGF